MTVPLFAVLSLIGCDRGRTEITCDPVQWPEATADVGARALGSPQDLGCVAGTAALVAGEPFATIQEAINAGDGQVVEICPGVWAESLMAEDATLVLTSVSRDAEDTILDGRGEHRILHTLDANVRIEALTLRNGYHDYDGGAVLAESCALQIERSHFADNVADYSGGAVQLSGARGGWGPGALRVTGSHFDNNGADYSGGAIDVGGWGTMGVDIDGTEFAGNIAGTEGGAVAISGWEVAAVKVTSSRFDGNDSGYEGGAMAVGGWEDMTLDVRGSVFASNTAGYEGGGVSIGAWADDSAGFRDSEFSENTAGTQGGAIRARSWGSVGLGLANVEMEGNTAPSDPDVSIGD